MEFLRQCFTRLPETRADSVAPVAGMHPAPTEDSYEPVLIDAETGEAYSLPLDFGDEPVPIVRGEIDSNARVDPGA